MFVALIAHDKRDSTHVRAENRPAHVEYLKASEIVRQAGPFLSEENSMIGSLIILEVETFGEAQDWADGDPYAKAGLFASVELLPWNRVIDK